MSQKLKDDLAFVIDKKGLNNLATLFCLKTSAGSVFLNHSLANTLLFDRKQQDYGPKNISGFGTFGVIVRMNDKFERLKTLYTKKRKSAAVNESIEDTLRDIANYAIIATLIERGEWPSV